MTEIIDAAHDYIKHGWHVVPLHGIDGAECRCGRGSLCPAKSRGKHPSLGQAWQKKALRNGADVQAWFDDHPHDNIGIATGKDSGLWVLDIDGADGVHTLTDLTTEHGPMPLTRMVRTGSGGLHYYFRHPADHEPRGTSGMIGPGIDVRGWNGQVVAPPSTSVRGHYDLLADHPIVDAPEWLLELTREHARLAVAGASAEVMSAERVDVEFLPARILDLAGTLVEEDKGRYKHFYAIVAACFEAGYSQGQTVTIVAPWCVAVKKFVGRIEAEVARSWGKLTLEAQKQNEWVDGIAGPATTPPGPQPDQNPTQPATDGTAALKPDPDPVETDDDSTNLLEPTWRPVDLEPILTGTYEPEIPSLLPRSDDQHLLYSGRVHSLHGESESGKSLVAQAETARLIKTGTPVLYIDFESDAHAVVGRLMEMGCTAHQIREDFDYIRPDNDPRKFAHEREELFAVLRTAFTLIVIDGVTDALGIFGAGSTDNDEIAAFMRTFPRMLARKTGAAVVLIDHVTKDAESRGRYALGGQAKMNALDGSAFVVEVTEPIGRGMRGVISLRVAKDRPGGVRPYAGTFRKSDRTQEAARVVVDSTGGSIEVTVEAPMSHVGDTPKPGGFRPSIVMEKVSDFLAKTEGGVSWRTIKDALGGNEPTLRKAVALLDAEGFITVETGARNAQIHSLTKPYQADLDPLSDTYSEWLSGRVTPVTPSDATSDAKSGEVSDAKPPPPLWGVASLDGPEKSVSDATSDAAISNLDYTACNGCGEEYLTEAIELGNGYCGDCGKRR